MLNHFFDYKPEVLALDEKELPHLQHLFENGTANGVPGMKKPWNSAIPISTTWRRSGTTTS